MGDVPAICQVSDRPIDDEFVDGATIYGPWACMHPDAHKVYGKGLGTGRGQKYRKVKVTDGSLRWLKVAG
jgi:hypothetical protein